MVRTSFIIFVETAAPLHGGVCEHYRRLIDNRLIKTWNRVIAPGYVMPCFQRPFNVSVGASLLAMDLNENACFLN
ncbi:hypothetical protein D3C84_947220 [compost metagenome]